MPRVGSPAPLALAVFVAICGTVAWRAVQSRGAGDQHLQPGALSGSNVLLVTIDSLRLDRLGRYRKQPTITPTLDRLVGEGLRYDSAYTTSPSTVSAHASLLTGQYPPRHGLRGAASARLASDAPSVAAALRSAGYRTAAFVSASLLGPKYGLARGFDVYDLGEADPRRSDGLDPAERPAERVAASALDWIAPAPLETSTGGAAPSRGSARGESDDRWFAWVHFFDPHAPHTPRDLTRPGRTEQQYDAEVASVDAEIGSMVRRLDGARLLANTLVIVTADHGEGLGAHGERTHGLFAYDSTLNVPLILWRRGVIRPSASTDVVSLADVAPTILDLLGVKPLAPMQGQRLPAIFAGDRPDADRAVYFEAVDAAQNRNWAPLRGVVSRAWKLIDLPAPELYDRSADPAESKNLYASRQNVVARLRQALDAASGPVAPLSTRVDCDTSAPARAITVQDDPKSLVRIDAALDDAAAQLRRGGTDSAIEMLNRAIAERPDLAEAYERLAGIYRLQGHSDLAIEVLEKGMRSGAANAGVIAALAGSLAESGRYDRAASLLSCLVRARPDDIDAQNRLGVACTHLGRSEEAEAAFRRAASIDPQAPASYVNLGALFVARGRLDDAVASLEMAIRIDVQQPAAHNALAAALARQGRRLEAVNEWKQTVDLDPQNFDALYNLAASLMQESMDEQARPHLERFVREAPVERYRDDIARVRALLANMGRQDVNSEKGRDRRASPRN